MIECIVENEKDAYEAEMKGIDRVELVSAIPLGGLTPSYGTIKNVLKKISIPVQVMIRPHNYSFFYNKSEKENMKEDISLLYQSGHRRFVLGAVSQNGKLDREFLEEIFYHFPQIEITFHRAFDTILDQKEAYRSMIMYKKNIKRVLTSGGAPNCIEGINSLYNLKTLEKELNGPKILPGSGLTIENLEKVHSILNSDEYHFGKGLRLGQLLTQGFSEENIKKVKQIIN
jgi:copper homeostasis protein